MNQKGFTLIELTLVVVVLAILAVTVAPRFLDLSSDARNAALRGLEASVVSALDISHTKLAIENLESEPTVWSFSHPEIQQWCDLCLFSYGYPANMPTTFRYLMDGVGIGDDFVIAGNRNGVAHHLFFTFSDYVDEANFITRDNCYIEYTPPTINEEFVLEFEPCT
ncbi:prepilin-type N-terminal cleavage/methylation domain-containing protein [Vibrio sp. TBV020]|uniref:prepilin-type N-terminal cleavage/methylation domain-containing protein n=1 Tax=Vibrio sp. TBV020 TaxID=3137398 RepID=UPI0038CD1B77